MDTQRIVAFKFADLIKHKRPMTSIVKKLPIVVGGERSVSTMELMSSFKIVGGNSRLLVSEMKACFSSIFRSYMYLV